MIQGKPKVKLFSTCFIPFLHRDVKTKSASLPSRRPITDAIIRVLDRDVPNDPRGRKIVDLLVEAVVFRAILKGDLKAFKELTDRVDGIVSMPQSDRPPVATTWQKRPRAPMIVPNVVRAAM
jgi:hypothetical protein